MHMGRNKMVKNMNSSISKLWIISILSISLLLLICPYALFAETTQVYTVAAKPTPKSNLSFPCYLSKVNSATKKLNIERQLIFKDKQGLMFVYSYSNHRRIILGSHTTGNFELNIIDMDNPSTENIVSVPQNDSRFFNSKLLYYSSSRLVNGLTMIDGDNEKLIGVDLSTGKRELLPWEDFKNIELCGRAGVWLNGSDYVFLSSNNDGSFDFFAGDSKIRLSESKMPDPISFEKDDIIIAVVRNSKAIVITAKSCKVIDPSGFGYMNYYILNKHNNSWGTITPRGELTRLRSFNSWLAGTVLTAFKGKESPGKENRRQSTTPTGSPASWHIGNEVYSPGLLYLYNIQTQQEYYLETGQGDSEVLLIEDETVYFRENNIIYFATIDEDQIVGKAELVRDPMVYDVHWLFTN
jgi:hypothetical protein